MIFLARFPYKHFSKERRYHQILQWKIKPNSWRPILSAAGINGLCEFVGKLFQVEEMCRLPDGGNVL